ncbi:MAG: circadian clock KaiB family protein [Stenomitos frigidus ULC029]
MNEVPKRDDKVPQAVGDDVTASFEAAIAQPEQQYYCLRLYIAGTTPRSMLALQRLKAICETHLQGQYELEVVDVYQTDISLLTDNIVAVPTLVKQLPSPIRRIIGDLSNTEKVLLGLDVIPK